MEQSLAELDFSSYKLFSALSQLGVYYYYYSQVRIIDLRKLR